MVEVQPAFLQHGIVLDEQPAVLDALALPQDRAQLELRGLLGQGQAGSERQLVAVFLRFARAGGLVR